MANQSERQSLNKIKPSKTELQMQFENAYSKPNKATGDQLAALYFQGGEGRPVIVKSNNAARPTGNFLMGGSEPVDSKTTAGKKQYNQEQMTGNFMYGNYGSDQNEAMSSVKPYARRL